MNLHLELRDAFLQHLEGLQTQLPAGCVSLSLNDCREHSMEVYAALAMEKVSYLGPGSRGMTGYWWYRPGDNHPYRQALSRLDPPPYQLSTLANALQKLLGSIPGVTVRYRVSPQRLYSWDPYEKRKRLEGYDDTFISFEIFYYPT